MKNKLYKFPFLILYIFIVPFSGFSQVTQKNAAVSQRIVEPGNCDYPLKWYADNDLDGFGDINDYQMACDKPPGFYVDNSDDCDDLKPEITTYTYYYDADGDGFGNPDSPWYACSPPLRYVSNNTDCNDNRASVNPNTKWYIDTDGDGVLSDLEVAQPITQCLQPGLNYISAIDSKSHWIHAISYDSKGNTTGASRTYFDDLGKPNVSLSKDYEQNRIWGTETVYDDFGRPEKSSFIAPSPLTTFEKTAFFKTATQGQAPVYPFNIPINTITSSQNFTATQTITVSGAVSPGITVNLSAPIIIFSNGFSVSAVPGSSFTASTSTTATNSDPFANPSLAGYYSDNNTLEPYQATATQPYSQANYDKLNPGNVINVVGGNKINGEWKTGYSYTVPAAQEMYYVYGSDYYEGPIVAGKEEVITKFYKSVSVDANGVENVAFSDGEGKVLASARSGGTTSYPVISLIGTQGFVDVHIPAGITSGISLIGGASLYKVYDLKTGLITSSLTAGNAYRIEAITPPTTDPKTYIAAGVPTNDPDALGISYRVNYYDYAVNIYNKTGQLTKSIQPNGYVASATIVSSPAYLASSNFASTYAYNSLGQVIETTSPDEGTSKFAYRKDGQIRYSQSALQSNITVSYTDYDTYGRPVESGVISTAPTKIWPIGGPDPDTTLLGTLAQRSEQTFTIFDDASNNVTSVPLPANLTLSSVLTAAGIPTTNYTQNSLAGNVAITYAKPAAAITAITWYSYDIYGRTEWMVQYNEGIGAKTIHYYYDYKGNVKKVLYQKDKTAELFAHQYTYDGNDVLTKVETSINNSTFITHADYSYYKTGELKRVNIAQGLQGLDYVYTLGGALKSINHPSLEAAKDPGGDSNDVFGITLDYYNGDYLRTGRNITTSPTAGADYNGNIKAARWANKGIAADYTNGVANQKGYLYNYNRNNWLTGATFGAANASTAAISADTKYREAGLTYDANGNIQSLQRTNDTGATVDNLTYNYTNAGKNQLNSVNDAAATAELTDIENQAAGNYTYDAIGQMTRTSQEDINYFYNTQGLVTQVNKGANAVVRFFYNERGQRIKKESYNTATPYSLSNTDYYTLDLSGNVMSIYNQPNNGTIVQKDLPIFGLSRLGVYNRASATSTYEITDHLGNVRAVVQKENGSPAIKSFADYYPFGEQLPMRNSLSNYRYTFQGQELDKETGLEAFQLRLWDGRIGRWLSPDPMGQYASPYLGMGNNPISRIDPDGGSDYPERDGYGCGDTWNDADGSWTWDSDQNMWLGQNGTTSNWSHSVTVGNFNSPMISQLSGFNSNMMDFERWRRDDNSNLLLHLGAELTYGTLDNAFIFLTGFGTNRRGISGETYDGDRGAENGLDGFTTLATAGFGAAAKSSEGLLKSTPKLWNSFQKMHVKPATRIEVSQAYRQMLLKNHNQFHLNKAFDTFDTFSTGVGNTGAFYEQVKR